MRGGLLSPHNFSPLFDLRLTPLQDMSLCVEEEEKRAKSGVSGCLSVKSDHSTRHPSLCSKEPGTSETL